MTAVSNPNCPPPGVTTQCCPNTTLPDTLHAIITAIAGCACAPSTITLNWDGVSKWTGQGALGSCGRNVTFSVHCDNTAPLAWTWRLDYSFSDNCIAAVTNKDAVSGGCTPPDQVDVKFTGLVIVPCCNGVLDQIDVEVKN
jgi:hypothetical protein